MGNRGDLVTLAAVKSHLGILDVSKDVFLATAISQVSSEICNYINRPRILPRVVTENYDGNGRDRLILRSWPVNSVSAVSINGVSIPAAPVPGPGVAPQSGWMLDPSDDLPPGNSQALNLVGYAFTRGRLNVQVTYSAGYSVSGEAAKVTGGKVAASCPYGAWATDEGLAYAGGPALTAVASAPAQGQYVVIGDGTYSLNSADNGSAVQISYGYIPYDLAKCATEWVSERYFARGRDPALRSETVAGIGASTYSQSRGGADMSEGVAKILNNYRAVVPI